MCGRQISKMLACKITKSLNLQVVLFLKTEFTFLRPPIFRKLENHKIYEMQSLEEIIWFPLMIQKTVKKISMPLRNYSCHWCLGKFGDWIQSLRYRLDQRSPTLLAPRAGFVEDNFSTTEWGDGFGMIQAHYIYCALYFYYYYIVICNEIIIQLTIMLTGGGAQTIMRAMGSGYKYRWSFARSAHPPLAPCSGPWPLDDTF